MLNEFLVVGGSVLTLFLMMAVGFFLGKLGMLSRQTLSQLSTLLLYIVSPAIMIETFASTERTDATVAALCAAGAVMAGTYLLNMLLIAPWFRRQRDDRGVMRFAAVYGNTGFMGIPLIRSVLGESGMLITVVALAVFNISIWTHGAYLIGGRARVSLKKAFLNPGVIGFAIALAFFALQIRLPAPLRNAVGFVADLNTPLAMIVIGGQMAAVELRSLFGDRRLYAVSSLKLLAVPLVTMLALLPFGLDPVTYTAAAILAGCPVAGATSLLCQLNGKDTALSAKLVFVSTALCIVTLPLIAMLAGQLRALIPY